MPFNRNSDERGSGGIFRVLIGTGIGVAAALVLALIRTCAALSARDPAALLLPLSMAALIIGAVVSGALSSVGGGAVSGLLGGALYVLVFWVISLFFRGDAGKECGVLRMLLGYSGCLLAAFLGGLAVSRGERQKGKVSVRSGAKSPAAMARERADRGRRRK